MNKYLTVGILILVVFLLVFYRNKIMVLFAKAKPVAAPAPAVSNPSIEPSLDRDKVLKRGVTGPEVKLLQMWLGVTPDGNFGPVTEAVLQDTKCFSQTTLNSYPDQTCVQFNEDDVDLTTGGDWSGGSDIFNSIV